MRAFARERRVCPSLLAFAFYVVARHSLHSLRADQSFAPAARDDVKRKHFTRRLRGVKCLYFGGEAARR